MRLLTHTNIIVDDFEMCKDFPKNTFIHFLSHFHFDHWFGLTPLWNYGIIFCTEITSKFILHKFPKIVNIVPLKYNTTYLLDLKKQELSLEKSDYTVKITLFDAHHIPGSCMILIEGFMGSILHTGDFRFTPIMQKESSQLFNTHIDELVFDNTYCNPMFNFPLANEVAKKMIDLIEQNQGKRVYIAMGALGQNLQQFIQSKEEICIQISSHFKCLLVVSMEKYQQMKAIGIIDMEIFTTDPNQGWIEIIKKHYNNDQLQDESIIITTDFLMLEHKNPDGKNFIVPYSLHSNFQELEKFVQLIRPAILKKLVIPFQQFSEYRRKVRINPLRGFQNYLKKLEQGGESGYSYLIKTHTDFTKLSKEYLQWMHQGKSGKFIIIQIIEEFILQQLGITLFKGDRKFRKRKIDQNENKISKKQQIMNLEEQYGSLYNQILIVFGAKNNKKKESLDDIASQLKSTHNNLLIDKFLGHASPVKLNQFLMPKQIQFDKDQQFNSLFESFIDKKN